MFLSQFVCDFCVLTDHAGLLWLRRPLRLQQRVARYNIIGSVIYTRVHVHVHVHTCILVRFVCTIHVHQDGHILWTIASDLASVDSFESV